MSQKSSKMSMFVEKVGPLRKATPKASCGCNGVHEINSFPSISSMRWNPQNEQIQGPSHDFPGVFDILIFVGRDMSHNANCWPTMAYSQPLYMGTVGDWWLMNLLWPDFSLQTGFSCAFCHESHLQILQWYIYIYACMHIHLQWCIVRGAWCRRSQRLRLCS